MRERYREERTTLKWPNGAARRAAAPFSLSFERTAAAVHFERSIDALTCRGLDSAIAAAATLGRLVELKLSIFGASYRCSLLSGHYV